MIVEKFKAGAGEKVSKSILNKFPDVSYNEVKKIIRNRDVKVNGKRVGEDIKINEGDEIVFYHPEHKDKIIPIVYEDENIVVANKPAGTETVNTTSDCVLGVLSAQLNENLFAVHRLDRNTTGLVIFAKNIRAKDSLDAALKERTIEKYYLALVKNRPPKNYDTLVSYLKKLSDESKVLISDFPQKDYKKIETQYKILDFNENFSILQVLLLTGKTHQIRAHLSHIGCPIVGDEKYGDSNLNRQFGLKHQCLCSYKIVFRFSKNDFLSYLDGKEIVLDKSNIDFLKFYK